MTTQTARNIALTDREKDATAAQLNQMELSVAEQLAAMQNEVANLRDQIQNKELENDDDYANAGALLKHTRSTVKTLDEKRKEITKPLREAKEHVDSLFSDPINGFKEVGQIAKDKMTDYAERERKKREEEARRRQQEAENEALDRAEKAGGEKADAIIEAASTESRLDTNVRARSDFGTTATTKTVAFFRVVDPTKIPADLIHYRTEEKRLTGRGRVCVMELDQAEISRRYKESGHDSTDEPYQGIPGIEIVRKIEADVR